MSGPSRDAGWKMPTKGKRSRPTEGPLVNGMKRSGAARIPQCAWLPLKGDVSVAGKHRLQWGGGGIPITITHPTKIADADWRDPLISSNLGPLIRQTPVANRSQHVSDTRQLLFCLATAITEHMESRNQRGKTHVDICRISIFVDVDVRTAVNRHTHIHKYDRPIGGPFCNRQHSPRYLQRLGST